MAKIVDSFKRTLPKLQARKIERELRSPSNQLIFPSVDAFKTALQDQLRLLLEEEFPLRFSPLDLNLDTARSSEWIDILLARLAGDLSSLFLEVDSLLQIEALQEQLYKEEIMNRLRRAVTEAEEEIERLELLRGSSSGLSEAIVEKFNSSTNRASRSNKFAHLLYVDPKTNRAIEPIQEMAVALNTGGLVLPLDISTSRHPSSINDITTADVRDNSDRFGLSGEPLASTNHISSEIGRLSNLIDRRLNTFWIKTLETKQELSQGAVLNLRIDLGRTPVAINYIEMQPVGNFNQELTSIHFLDELSNVIEIEIGSSPVSLSDNLRLYFNEVTTKEITLTFNQKNSTPSLKDDLTILRKYQFGFDNILMGKTKYEPLGFYASRTLSLPKINKLYLTAQENASVGVPAGSSLATTTDPMPTVEYWVAIRELDSSDTIINTQYLPILPQGRTSTTEKIEPSTFDRTQLQFVLETDLADASESLKLFKDGIELIRPEDYTYIAPLTAVPAGSTLLIPNSFRRQNDYIAVYTPLHTDEDKAPVPFTDMTGLVRYNADNTIDLTRAEGSRAVKSEANLLIIMRGTANRSKTSVVDEFAFAVG